MALVLADRVQETSSTTGTGTLTLAGAVAGFQTFAAGIGAGNTCYYTIQSTTGAWEVGVGTVGTGTLARTTLISSSSGSFVSFTGTLTVFVTYPAEKSVYGEGAVIVAPSGALLPIASGGTGASTAGAALTNLGAQPAFGSQTANTVYAAPDGSAGTPTFRAIVVADVPTLNQNTTGTASNVTGTVAIGNGGTGATTAATARTALGLGTIATQAANSVAITGGAVDGTTVGSTTAAAGSFTTLNSSGATRLGGASGNQSLQVNNVASAVNYAQIVGAVTGQYAALTTQGADANVGLLVNTKGTYPVTINSALEINPTASSVNFISFYGAVTGGAPVFVAKGSDANVAMGFATKGTQGFAFYTNNFGAQQAAITHTASAVNYLNLTGAATGAAPKISAQGSDANIGLVLSSKGTGVVALGGSTVANSGFSVTTPTGTVDRVNMYSSAGGNPYFEATGTSATINLAFYSKGLGQVLFGRNGGAQNFLIGSAASSVNFLQAVAAATTAAPELSAQGSDANINLKLTSKGTGTLQFGTYTAGIFAQAGYITITDAGGTSRRLLVG